ncbi:MAG: hypothetical protein H6696_10395 [Deferribacteres bacterium]|nr:hypothetical protein [candidate division KSB1 bacterium]MCB9502339.1 hypothetical protein [Deferribacteres bacterium]
MKFTKADIENIAEALNATYKDMGTNYRLTITGEEDRRISLEIYPHTKIGSHEGSLLIVYTSSAFLQLQFCTGYVISKMLGEVTFVAQHMGRISGLIVEAGAGCSLYSNVDESVLSGDFTRLGPEVMMSSIALSLSEHLLGSGDERLDADALVDGDD